MTKSKKRKSGQDGFQESGAQKRARVSDGSDRQSGLLQDRPGPAGSVNPTTGLRSAFPGLEDDDVRAPFYGPANDGLDYLRMVRSEARTVPDLLVAPKNADEHEVSPDAEDASVQGYYKDGAYTAAPTSDCLPDIQAAQARYYEGLMARYRRTRGHLHDSTASASDSTYSADPVTDAATTFYQWRHLLQSTDPTPAQISSMDQNTVLRLVRLMTSSLLKRGRPVARRTGRWIWALLARAAEPGCLVSEEIGIVRDLGKRAVWLSVGLREQGMADALDEHMGDDDQQEEDEGSGSLGDIEVEPTTKCEPVRNVLTGSASELAELVSDGGIEAIPTTEADEVEEGEIEKDQAREEDEEEDVEAAKRRLLSRLNPDVEQTSDVKAARTIAHREVEGTSTEAEGQGSDAGDETMIPAEQVTKATLEAIITIVGEFYGQRDLLEFRGLW